MAGRRTKEGGQRFARLWQLVLLYFWVVFTTTRSPQSKLFRSTVFESSRRYQANAKRTREGSGCAMVLRLVSAVWLRVFDVDVSPSWLGNGKGAG